MKKIMFSDKDGLTQAVLDGRKTQTRRIVSESLIDEYDNWLDDVMCISVPAGTTYAKIEDFLIKRSRYRVGEIVAIAQRYNDIHEEVENGTLEMLDLYCSKGWNNKMFVKAELMPHQIRITNVRIERLQDISDEDCLKEGILKEKTCYGEDSYNIKIKDKKHYYSFDNPREAYAVLIDKVAKKGDWNKNPYVYVYDFELVK